MNSARNAQQSHRKKKRLINRKERQLILNKVRRKKGNVLEEEEGDPGFSPEKKEKARIYSDDGLEEGGKRIRAKKSLPLWMFSPTNPQRYTRNINSLWLQLKQPNLSCTHKSDTVAYLITSLCA